MENKDLEIQNKIQVFDNTKILAQALIKAVCPEKLRK